jgi:hypothetical protein
MKIYLDSDLLPAHELGMALRQPDTALQQPHRGSGLQQKKYIFPFKLNIFKWIFGSYIHVISQWEYSAYKRDRCFSSSLLLLGVTSQDSMKVTKFGGRRANK